MDKITNFSSSTSPLFPLSRPTEKKRSFLEHSSKEEEALFTVTTKTDVVASHSFTKNKALPPLPSFREESLLSDEEGFGDENQLKEPPKLRTKINMAPNRGFFLEESANLFPSLASFLGCSSECIDEEDSNYEITMKNLYAKTAKELAECNPKDLEKKLFSLDEGFKYVDILGKGDFITAYLFQTDTKSVVVKIPHFKKTQPIARKDEVVCELTNYMLLNRHKFPVCAYLNFDTFLSASPIKDKDPNSQEVQTYLRENFTDGYYLTDYIPDPYKIPESESDILVQMGDETSLLFQLKKMFEFGLKHAIPIDLKPENLKVSEDNKLTLIDLYPQNECYGKDNPFIPLIPKNIRAFTKKLESKISEETIKELKKFLDPTKYSR